MQKSRFYNDGSRDLQDRMGSRGLADRLVDKLARDTFTDDDRAFIESRPMFFLATADAEGRPDCSYKGGDPGFVRVVGPGTLAFPSYDGNGMFRSLGNVLVNPFVGMYPRRQGRPLGRVRGSAAGRPRGGGGNFSELPSVHPSYGDGRAIDLHADRRPGATGTRVERAARVSRRAATQTPLRFDQRTLSTTARISPGFSVVPRHRTTPLASSTNVAGSSETRNRPDSTCPAS